MSRCGDCEEKLGQKATQGDCVICSSCRAKFHYDKCSGVSSTTWKTMGEVRRDIWKCQRCRKQRTESEKEIEDVQINPTKEPDEQEARKKDEDKERRKTEEREEKTRIEERMIRMEKKIDLLIGKYDEIKDMLNTIEFLSKEQEDLKKENEKVKSKMKEIEEKVQILENKDVEYKKLEQTIETLSTVSREKEQYDRNRNLEIGQLDWLENERIPQLLERVAENFNIKNFHHDQVEAAHRIPNKNRDKPSTLIVQFKHREARDNWLEQKKRRVTNDNIYQNGNNKQVYLNENMTSYYKDLFWKTKNFARVHNIKYVWFKNGKLMMRKNEHEQRVILVKREKDLQNLST